MTEFKILYVKDIKIRNIGSEKRANKNSHMDNLKLSNFIVARFAQIIVQNC